MERMGGEEILYFLLNSPLYSYISFLSNINVMYIKEHIFHVESGFIKNIHRQGTTLDLDGAAFEIFWKI